MGDGQETGNLFGLEWSNICVIDNVHSLHAIYHHILSTQTLF